jgi:hypothetical protein
MSGRSHALFVLALTFVVTTGATAGTVNVNDHGARPNDGMDDSAAVQRAINASAGGDTILFEAGTYHFARRVDPIGGGRTLRGQGTTLQATGNQSVFYFRGKGLLITGFRFVGRGIFMDHPNGQMIEDLVIDNNTFSLAGGGQAVEFTSGLRNTRITNNTFDPIRGDNGIYGYAWDNLIIANNAFLNGNEGIHIIAFNNNSKKLLIEQNYFSGLSRMGIEYQGYGVDTVVQDNYYENPVMHAEFARNNDTFAYSIICDASRNTIVRRNTAVMPTSAQSPDRVGVRIVFELGGFDLICEDNYSIGGNHVIAANGTRATGVAQNNRIMQYKQGPGNANGARVRFLNNGADVILTWDVNRGKPGPNKRLPGTGPGFTTDIPLPGDGETVIETPTDANAPTQLVATASGPRLVELTWKDNSQIEVSQKVERSYDKENWLQISIVGINIVRFVDPTAPPDTTIYYRVRGFSVLGDSEYSNIAEVKTPPLGGPAQPPGSGGNGGSGGTGGSGGSGGEGGPPLPPGWEPIRGTGGTQTVVRG